MRDNPARLRFAPFQNWEHAHHAWLTIRGKRSQSIGHNTSLVALGNDDVGVRLHGTVIVIFHRDNTVTLDSGRYRTVTTKARMNAVLPPTLRVDQVKGDWWVREVRTGDKVPFFDGMRIKLPYEDNPGFRSGKGKRMTLAQLEADAAKQAEHMLRKYGKDEARRIIVNKVQDAPFLYPDPARNLTYWRSVMSAFLNLVSEPEENPGVGGFPVPMLAEDDRFRIFFVNHGYFHEEDYATLDEALREARHHHFDAAIYRNNQLVAAWGVLSGTRYY